MTSNDADINLLHLKLNALEERVKVLEGKKDMIIKQNKTLVMGNGPWNCADVTPHCIAGTGYCKCSYKAENSHRDNM